MTSDQLTLEDAIAQGQDGATLASEAAGIEWLDYATEFVRTYLEQHDFLHVDELWDAGLAAPVSPRALGAVMKHAARSGWMEPIESNLFGVPGEVCRPSVRSHGQLKRVWRSLL